MSMGFVISILFLTNLQLISGHHPDRPSSSTTDHQSIDVDVIGGIESGFFLLPASVVTSGGGYLNHDQHSNDSSSASIIDTITSFYSSLSSSKPISVKATFGTITATETVFPHQGTHSVTSSSSSPPLTTKNQTLKSNGPTNGKSNGPTLTPPRNILNGNTFREKITDSTLVEIDSGHGKHSIAYLVTHTVSRNSPVVRVLFYTTHPTVHSPTSIVTSSASGDPVADSKGKANYKESKDKDGNTVDGSNSGSKSGSGVGVGHPREASPCIFVSVSKDGENLIGSCSPINNREGACLVEITLPAYWWPPVELDSPKLRKPGSVSVDYKTFHTNQCIENGSLTNENVKRLKSLTDAFTPLGQVTLTQFNGPYEEVTNDDIVRILIPQHSIYPNHKIYIPVCFRHNPNYPLTAFRLRARVKSGLRILGVTPSPMSPWKINLEVNSKQTLATVTAKLRDNYMDMEDLQSGDSGIGLLLSQEIYSWLIQVNENVDFSDNGRIVWQIEYITDSNGFDSPGPIDTSMNWKKESSSTLSYTDRDTSKLSSILDIQKDDIQAVIGITSSLSMINIAVLTGKQVAQSLRVFAVSQAGRLGDVTLQASCTSTDESVVKVSPSCTSIYLDGSEIRGSSNATIVIKYGTYSGTSNFIIWVPKLPLEVRVSDTKLSQIKGWKIPHLKREGRRSYHHHHHHHQNSIHSSNGHKSRRSSSSSLSSSSSFHDKIDFTDSNDIGCRLRHQQAYIQVYARFFSTDHNSGRESYLLNRKIMVKVTKLVAPFFRVSDNRVALIRSNIIEGISPGRSEIQIVSPITNQMLGSTEVHVASDKETISSLKVNLVTGLSLTINPEPSIPNVFKIITNVSSQLVNQYQEGLLDIKIQFSDSSVTSLADIADSDYQLSVNTADNSGLAYAPLIGQPYPRVIAIGHGNNQLSISLEVSDQCQRKRTQPLAMTQVNANVDLNLPTGHLQNDADFRKFNGILVHRNQNPFQSSNHPSDRDDIDSREADGDHFITTYGVNGQPLSENHYNNAPSIEARSNRAISPSELTPLEIGMYSMLGVFTLAVSLFIVSCLVFRIKGKQASSDLMVATLPLPMNHHSVTNHHQVGSTSNQKVVANANDWIWLGKATLQRNSPPTSAVKSKGNRSEITQGLISLNDLKNRDRNRQNLDIPSTGEDDGSNRMSTISYPGSEISIRITTNPVEEASHDHQDATPKPSTPFGINKEIEKFYRSTSPAVQTRSNATTASSIPPPVPARRTQGYPSSTTHHSSHIAPPVPPPIPLHQNSSRDPLFNKSDPIIIPNHKPPHIPPRLTRSIRCDQVMDSSSLSSSYTSQPSPRPPPVPPHSANSRTTKKPPLPPHRTVPSKFKRPSVTQKTLSNNTTNGQLESLLPSSSSSSSSSASTSCHNNTKDPSNRLINAKSLRESINHHPSIIVNPSSALTQLTQENLNKVTKEMNYDQLMEYFQNLKESSA